MNPTGWDASPSPVQTLAMPVILVRHAVALSRRSWVGDDADRPLDDRGRRQAEALHGSTLAPFAIDRVLSSPALRCVATVAPTASANDLAVEQEDDLFEGHGPDAIALVRNLLRGGGDEAVVLCSHGDVIPEVLVALERVGTDLGTDRRCQKGSAWVLERGPEETVSARYLPPPA